MDLKLNFNEASKNEKKNNKKQLNYLFIKMEFEWDSS